MSMIKKWEEKFPILFSIAVLVLFDVVTGVIGWIIAGLITIDGYYLQLAASELLGAIAAAVGVGHLNTEHNALIAKFTFGHSLEPPRS